MATPFTSAASVRLRMLFTDVSSTWFLLWESGSRATIFIINFPSPLMQNEPPLFLKHPSHGLLLVVSDSVTMASLRMEATPYLFISFVPDISTAMELALDISYTAGRTDGYQSLAQRF